jgi:hypothetical protein
MDVEDASVAFDFGQKVDFFLAVGLFEMLREPARLCKNMASASSPAGHALVIIPNRRHLHYRAFRLLLWVACWILRRKNIYIYNNGVTMNEIARWMEEADFGLVSRGTVVGVPASIIDRMPKAVQQFTLRFDHVFWRFLGGAYEWILVKR